MIFIKDREDFMKRAYSQGLSISQLSEEVGFNRSTLSRVAKGLCGISPNKAKKVSERLNADFDDLFQIVDKH